MTRWLVGGLAALCVASFGCGGGSDEKKDGCATAADCGAGQTCVDGTCRSEAPACGSGCASPTPVCDEASGTCKACTAAEGCGGGTPFCDTAADGGTGACVACRDTDDCSAPSVCDSANHTCVGCTATEGCHGRTPVCDAGTCVACTAGLGCDEPEFCDLSVPGGACVTCTATAGCEAPLFCDLAIPDGLCVACTDTAGCDEGLVCDRTVAPGRCVTCTATAGCDAGTFCDLAVGGGACVTCTANGVGCAEPTPVCDTSVPGGRCQGCIDDDDCEGVEFCDEGRKRCVVCNDANRGCEDPWPHCDPTAHDGRGECAACLEDGQCPAARPICHPTQRSCVACRTHDDCGGATPFCGANGVACVECLEDRDCANGESCRGGACLLEVSAAIDDVRNAANNATLALPIDGALVTYARLATPSELAGFFLQGEPSGPAIFVAVVPGTLNPVPQPGDRVSLTVTRKSVNGAGVTEIAALVGWSILERNLPLAPLVQDLSADGTVVSRLDDLEGELVSFTGTISNPGVATNGFTRLQFTTAGFTTPSATLRLRVPTDLRVSMGLTAGCRFTLVAGPMWREGPNALPSAYVVSDFTNVSCP